MRNKKRNEERKNKDRKKVRQKYNKNIELMLQKKTIKSKREESRKRI